MHNRFLTKSRNKFYAIYLVSIACLFAILFYFAYNYQKQIILNSLNQEISTKLIQLEKEIKNAHQIKQKSIELNATGFDIAFIDNDNESIASTSNFFIDPNNFEWLDNNNLCIKHTQTTFFLGIKYIVCCKKADLNAVIIELLIIFCSLMAIMSIVGFGLAKIAIAPAVSAFESIDTFIKYTTHDINTPIASIMSNTKLLSLKIEDIGSKKIIDRIEISAKSLNILYEDLLFLNFDKQNFALHYINVSDIIGKRLELFFELLDYKKITLKTDIVNTALKIAENDFARLFDNILSNAVKYSNTGGEIFIKLDAKKLLIKDNGIGIKPQERQKIFNRYYRGVSFEKGIGIGMEIIARVCNKYKLELEINSMPNQGSEVIIFWSKYLL